MRTAVVFPAPFGPSTPSTVPLRAARSTCASALVSPKDLVSPVASIARSVMRPAWAVPLTRHAQLAGIPRTAPAARSTGRSVQKSFLPNGPWWQPPVPRLSPGQINAVLIERGQRDGNPSAVPPMRHVLRRFRRVNYAFCAQERVIVGVIGPEHAVPADPDAVAGQERRPVRINKGVREAVIGLEIRVGAVVSGGIVAVLIV